MSDTELAQRLKDLVEARQQGRKIDPDFAEEFAIRDLLTQHGLRPEIGVDPRSQFRGFEVEGPLQKVPFVGRYLSKVVPKRYLDYLNGWTRLAANPHTGEIQVGGGLSVGPQGIPGRVGALTRMPDGLTAYVRGELDFETASKVFGSLGKLGPAGQAGGGGFVEFYGEGKVDAHGVVHGFAQLHVKLPVTAGKVTPRVARNWSFTWDLRTNEFKVHGSGGWVQLNVGGHGVRTDGTNHQLMYMGPQLKEGKAKPWEKGVPGATTKSAELQAGVRGRYTFQNRPLAQGLTRLFDVFGWIGMSSALAAERLDRGWEDLLDWVDRSPVPTGRDLPESWQRALGVRPAGAPPDWGKVDLSEYDEEDGDQERPAGPDQAGSGEGSGSDGGGNNAGDGNPSDGPVQSESGRAASSQAGPDGGPDPNYDGDPGSPDPGPVDPGGYESPGDPHNDNEAENQGDNQSGSQVGNPSDNGSNQSSNPSSPDPGGHESPGDPHNDNEAENQGDDQSGSQAGNPSNDGPVQSESGRAASSQAGPDGGPDPNYDGGSTTTDPGGGEPAGGGDTDADTGSCNCV